MASAFREGLLTDSFDFARHGGGAEASVVAINVAITAVAIGRVKLSLSGGCASHGHISNLILFL